MVSRSVCHAPSITHSLTLAAGLHQVISGAYKLALHYSPGARLSLPLPMQVSPAILLPTIPVSRSCLSPTMIPASSFWIPVHLSPVPVSRSCLSPTTIPASSFWISVRLSPVPVSRSCLSPTTIPASSFWISVRLSPVPVSRSCLSPTMIPASSF